jgi:hypothetical protein
MSAGTDTKVKDALDRVRTDTQELLAAISDTVARRGGATKADLETFAQKAKAVTKSVKGSMSVCQRLHERPERSHKKSPYGGRRPPEGDAKARRRRLSWWPLCFSVPTASTCPRRLGVIYRSCLTRSARRYNSVWGESLPCVGSGSDTFLFHTVIRAVSVRFFADRSALPICGFVSWEFPLKSIVSAGAVAARWNCSPTVRTALPRKRLCSSTGSIATQSLASSA